MSARRKIEYGETGAVIVSSENRQIAYTKEAKEFIAAHPGLMHKLPKLIEDLRASHASQISEDGISIIICRNEYRSAIYRLIIGDKEVFIKV